MKIRSYPKKAQVQDVLLKAIRQEEESIRECQTKLDMLNSSVLVGLEDTSFGSKLIAHKQRREVLNERLELLNSHSPPEIMMEMDL